MRRRAFGLALVSLGLTGAARPEREDRGERRPERRADRPDKMLHRRAEFEEVGDAAMMTVEFPELLRSLDRETMAAVDSGFETTLAYEVVLYDGATHSVLERHGRIVKIRYDYMNRRYEVTTRDDDTSRSRLWFTRRSQAVAAATKLSRIKVGRTRDLPRGDLESGPFYYVTIVGQRNPLTPVTFSRELDPGTGRGQGRDTRWFSRFVNFLAQELPDAERTVRYKTQPFFLVAR